MKDKIKITIVHPEHNYPAVMYLPADTTHLDRNTLETIEDTIAASKRGRPQPLPEGLGEMKPWEPKDADIANLVSPSAVNKPWFNRPKYSYAPLHDGEFPWNQYPEHKPKEDQPMNPNNLNFGEALQKLKDGQKLAREGWNGKGMFVVYQKGYPDGIPCNKQTAQAWGLQEGDLFKCDPYLQIRTASGSHAMWVPSISDILAADWKVV